MKIRTINELQDYIDRDLAWRKKELSAIKSNIKEARKFAKDTALRSGVALLYAHWEGFIKNVATYYLSYVSSLQLPYSQLKPNFLAISIKYDIDTFINTQKATKHTEIVNKIFSTKDTRSKIPVDNIVKTNSNLNSEIFKEIMTVIGLKYDKYKLNFKLIDEQLLKMRNEIAHGEHLEKVDLDESKFNMLYVKVVGMINDFSTQVLNAAILKEYFKESES